MKYIDATAICLLSFLVLSGCTSTQKSSASSSERIVSEANYEHLKSLSGDWHLVGGVRLGKKVEANFEEPFLSYSVSSGGHAVIEKLFVGKPNEMVSIYYLDMGRLNMDHYCSLGNQPKMVAMPSDDNEITFQLVGISNLNSEDELHISSHALKFDGPDEMTVYWGAT